MPSFSLKRLLCSMTLIALGVAAYGYIFAHPAIHHDFGITLWIVGGAYIGGGALLPFGRQFEGAIIGALAAGLLMLTGIAGIT